LSSAKKIKKNNVGNSIHTLAIDDDKISQKFIGRALTANDLIIKYADDGKEVLQKKPKPSTTLFY
jgi:CheY-like chemotaxis protein